MMSSVEIVEVINQLRPAGKAELRHDNFMKKMRKHPGINGLNFQGVYSDPKGEQRPLYYLPKREAELMVMSESLDVQTQVYDRLAVLEVTNLTIGILPSKPLAPLLQQE
jgi:hypothetical protein